MTEKNDRIELDVDKYPNITKLGVEKIEVLNPEKCIIPFNTYLYSPMFVISFKRSDGWDAITIKTEEQAQTDYRIKNGWSMLGKVHEDYFYWIEEFTAFKDLDIVFGNFLEKVFCSSLEALEDFLENFEVERWDFADI